MKFISIEPSQEKLVDVLVSVNVGWVHEPVGKRGISHFLEHAIFLGNKEYPDPDRKIAKYGVTLGGETLEERTVFYFTALKKDVYPILQVLISLIYEPSFPENKVEEEKQSKIIPGVVKETDYYPWELAYEWARNLVFEWDFRYSMGTEKELLNISIEDLRDWHRKYYHSNNSFILHTGATLLDDNDFEIPVNDEKPEPQRISHKKRKRVIKIGIKNAEIVYGIPFENYDIKTHILSIIFGNYPISLFWQNFHRDAYMVDCKVEWHGHGGIFFYIGSNTRDDVGIYKKFKTFFDSVKISPSLVERAKRILHLEILEMQRSSYALQNFLKIDPMFRFQSIPRILQEIESVTAREVKEYLDEILDWEKIKIAVVK